MKYFLDTEFLEDGKTIELISIGIVAEDGRELYLINRDAPWPRIKNDPWLMANVVPYLPQPDFSRRHLTPKAWLINFRDSAVQGRPAIAERVERFLLGDDLAGGEAGAPETELWANYGAYDFVALCQLFGRMIDRTPGMPMHVNDLQQELRRHGNPPMPEQTTGMHNALEDARHLKACFEALSR